MPDIPNVPNQNISQPQSNDILKEPSLPDDKPLDLNQLVFKSMPKGYAVPKNYVQPQINPHVVPSTAAIAPAASAPAPTNAIIRTPVPRSHKTVWISFLVVVILLLVAGGIYYFFFNKSTPKSSITPLRNPVSTTATTSSTSGAGTTASTTKKPVVFTSAIDPAWLVKYFEKYLVNNACPTANQNICGDAADPDHDGLTNLDEFRDKTDPTNPDTDSDGISDGDEVHVFETNPLTAHTSGNAKYTDSGDITYKYNSVAKANFTPADLERIAGAIKEFGLHAPTTKTLTPSIIQFYTSYTAPASK